MKNLRDGASLILIHFEKVSVADKVINLKEKRWKKERERYFIRCLTQVSSGLSLTLPGRAQKCFNFE